MRTKVRRPYYEGLTNKIRRFIIHLADEIDLVKEIEFITIVTLWLTLLLIYLSILGFLGI